MLQKLGAYKQTEIHFASRVLEVLEIKKGLGHESMGPRGPGYDLDKLCAAIITYYLYLNTKCPRREGGGG